MEHVDLREKSGQVLAYLGDSVWETTVRLFWLKRGLNLFHLNKEVKKYVNAKQQSLYYRMLVDSKELGEEDLALMNRAKNANIRSFPQSCSNQEYREATAFEALIGAWYLQGKQEKINKLSIKILEG